MPKQRAKVDANHAAIVDALRRCGCTVQSLAATGHGCPDLLVGASNRNILLEVKGPKGRPTPDQEEWLMAWKGQYAVVRTVDEAIAVVFRALA